MKPCLKNALNLAAAATFLFLPGPGRAEDFRTFTNAQGATISARLISVSGSQVTVEMPNGRRFVLEAATLSAADQAYIKTAAAQLPAAGAAPKAGTAMAGPNDKISLEEVNALASKELFSDKPLWQTPADEVAARLGLAPESKTSRQASYRSYPKDDYRLFGARPYSIALYAEGGQAASLSIVFANKGDLFSASGSGEMHFDKNTPPEEAAKIVKKAMDADLDAISKTLTAKLGEPKRSRFGEGKVGRMTMQRWDWRGHSLLLAEAEGEYVGLQVVTTTFADAGGKVARMSDVAIREMARTNVQKRPGGDVVIQDIPMVDQGPKGYCAPATAERVMRYLGVPADMYILANAGETGYGGGTSVRKMLEGAGRHIKAKGRSFDTWDGELKISELARHIDKGLPVMWSLYSTKEFNEIANRRTQARKSVGDWAAWKSQVSQEAAASALAKDEETAHVVLIIGYNKDTGEIAFSDSWGERYTERWITLEEAQQISQGRFYLVGF